MIRELTTSDLPAAVSFIAEQIRLFRGESVSLPQFLHLYEWLFVQNPQREADFIGWGLFDDEGVLRGTHLASWEKYSKGNEIRRCFVSTNSYVDEAFRGPEGLMLMLNMKRRVDADWCMCTTANVNSGRIWNSLKGHLLCNSDEETVIALNPVRLGIEFAAKKFPFLRSLSLSKIVAQLFRPFAWPLFGAYSYDVISVSDVSSWVTPENERFFETNRDKEYINWRYFQHPSRATKLLKLRSDNGAVCYVGVHRRVRGSLKILQEDVIIDLFGDCDEFSCDGILATVVKSSSNRPDILTVRLGVKKKLSTLIRVFSYIRKLDYPTHWGLFNRNSAEVYEWMPMPADGDSAV